MTKVKPAHVEIFTDISHHHTASGWGAVIIRVDRRGGIVEARGRIRNPPLNGNTDILEARAIANGLHKAKLERLIMPGERVKVWTDNAGVVRRWRGKVKLKRPSPDIDAAFDVVRRIVRELDCVLEVKHVEGHQPAARILSGNHRATMNARADHLARQAISEEMRGAGPVNNDNWPAVVARYRPPLLAKVRDAVARLTGEA